jgi:Ca2+-transporting ATPase
MGTVTEALADAHALPAAAVAQALNVDPAVGLDPTEVERRAARSGPNALEAVRRTSLVDLVWEAATEPFVLLLLGAGVLAVVLGEVRDGLLVIAGLVPIVAADVITEYRGDRALDALRDASAPRARVRRAQVVTDVDAASLVSGDVVILRTGDVVPADLRVVRADRLVIDRSVLTGESIPEPADTEPDAADAPLADRRSMAYSGTSVVGGRGEGVVVAIGRAAETGRIAGGIGARGRRRSPLQRELDRLVRILLAVAIALIAIVTGLGFVRGQEVGANLLAGISAAIASIPEEPPILLAVILGLGAYRLLKRGVLVRRLNAEETLGAIDLIVTDKTGTLTHNRLEVVSVMGLDGPLGGADRLRALTEALRAEDDAWVRVEGAPAGSFTTALARAVEAAGGDPRLDPGDLREADPPEHHRPMSRTISAGADGPEELAIGAPEMILELAEPSATSRSSWETSLHERATNGERLVGVARRLAGAPWACRAMIGFADPLRDGIPVAIRMAQDAGIHVIVVTGDHPRTAAAIAADAGLDRAAVVLGPTLAAWDDATLTAELPRLQVVARSTPDQKERLVRLARADGRTVAVTGDGVNDAPAMNRADVAVAMGSGTAVAREAADLVLGDDSFATLLYGLAEGRRIVDNVQKGLIFLISTHVALLGFILIATIYGFGQPLLPIQILWLELFIDVSASIAFELEKPEPDLMRRPPRRQTEPLLTPNLLGRIVLAGGFSAVAALFVMATHPGGPEHARWLAYTVLVCGQAVRAYANRSVREPIWRLPANRFLLAAGIAVIAIQAVIPSVPVLADAFRATPLDLTDWTVVAVIALAPALLAQVVRSITARPWIA